MSESLKGAIRSRMVWLGLALAVFGFLQTNSGPLQAWIPPKVMGLLDMGFGLAVVVLRFMTTEAIRDKA